ncbi:MAG: hypothetical protein IRZ16_05010 [Myxococcaceae bacterium]|nr:hypothetical protein [Myxococcaceae bacterium]
MKQILSGSGVVVAVAMVLSGCGTNPLLCAQVACDCAPPINVTVQRAGGGAIADVTLEGADLSSATCSEDAAQGKTFCFAIADVGTHAFDVKAPGFETKHVDVTVTEGTSTGCCQCAGSDRVELTLDPMQE